MLIYHELRQFRELQTRFFTMCASSFQTHEQVDLRDDSVDDSNMGTTSNQFAT